MQSNLIIYIIIFIIVYDIIFNIICNKSKSKYRYNHYYKFYEILNLTFIYKTLIKIYRSYYGLNKEISYKIMDDVHKVLNKYKIFFWLSEGTALGIYRENDLIDHDDDIDFSFMSKYNDVFEKYCIKEFMNKGYIIGKMFNFYYLIKEGMFVDFDIIYNNDISLANNMNSTEEIMPYIQDFYKKEWNNKMWNLPKESYYKYLYGDDYMIPIKNKKLIK